MTHTCYNSLASHYHDGGQCNPKCGILAKVEHGEARHSFEGSCLVVCQDLVIPLCLVFLIVEILGGRGACVMWMSREEEGALGRERM